jgi:IS6 family transposase
MNKYQPRDFKWRHFHGEVIMQCVRWYCKYGISFFIYSPSIHENQMALDEAVEQ